MSSSSQTSRSSGPLGGIFGFIGLLVGAGYGAQLPEASLATMVVGGLIGAAIGGFVEHVVARLLVIALFVGGIMMRQAFFDGVAQALSGAS